MATIEEIKAACDSCHDCPLGSALHIFGEGKTKSPGVLLLGSSPFTGPPDDLLRQTLKDYYLEDDFYLTNVVKCKPSDDQAPTKEDIKACYQWLSKQVKTIKPKVIVTLGNTAARTLLGTDLPNIIKINGHKHMTVGGRLVVTLIHSADALRYPDIMSQYLSGFDALIQHLLVIEECPF